MTWLLLALGGAGAPTVAAAQRVDLRAPTVAEARRSYRWHRRRSGYESLCSRLAPPPGFARVKVARRSYAHWLRHLPLLPTGTPVRSFKGRVVRRAGDPALAAVVDLDVGRRDRQQCVDTIIRLRGEYLYFRGAADRAAFAWPGGRRFGWRHWRRGLRPVREGRRWAFRRRARPSRGYRAFRRYLGYIFSWTGTAHQLREPRVAAAQLRAGDFFIQGGSPGHAVVVLDVARNPAGRRVALLGQGFMPAQDLHVLRRRRRSPWFELAPPRPLRTPLWGRPFSWRQLRRFAR